MTRRNEFVLVGAITLVGAALRLYQIGTQSLWLDELFSVMIAQGRWTQVIVSTAQGDTNPPLFNLLLHFALQFGSGETIARALSCLFSILTIPLFYVLVRELFEERVAALASFALAINPFQVYFAQEARMYALLGWLSLAALFFFVRAWRDGKTRNWVLFIIAMTLAFYTHTLAFLNLLALDVFVLTRRRELHARWRGLAGAHLAIGGLFAPWVIILVQQVARVQSGFWGTMPSVANLITTPYLFLFSDVLPAVMVPIALFVALALIVFAAVATIRAIGARRADSSALLLVLSISFVPLLALFGLSFTRPIYVERTLLPASFGLYLLIAWSMLNAPPRALLVPLGAMLLLGMLVALPEYYYNPANQKPPMREAVRTLSARFQPGDVIAHTSDSSALAFMYYAPNLPSYFIAGDPDYVTETTRGRSGRVAGLVPETVSTIVAGHSRVWLVVALDHNVDYQKSREQEFEARFRNVAKLDVGGIAAFLFEVK